MSKLNLWRTICIVVVFCALAAIGSPANIFTTLANFKGKSNGAFPVAGLIQATDGNFYGTTPNGGDNDDGTVFKITSAGKLTKLHSFNFTDGASTQAGLVQATDGNFYGTTQEGGDNSSGTVFKITPAGKLTTLYSFCSKSGCIDGETPVAGLIQATDGNFYGTTAGGGTNLTAGTVFKITPAGKLTTLYSFCSKSNCIDGTNPQAGLIQATDGNFYGTTELGGTDSNGTVFKITPGGKLTTLHSFVGTDGSVPVAELIQATDGNFYGTAKEGGDNNDGTVFKITPAGMLTALYSFCSQADCIDGFLPYARLVQATDGNLYGTTFQGGAGSGGTSGGTVFRITLAGKLTTLYSFCSKPGCTDGTNSRAGLIQATNGKFYGTTSAEGSSGDGTVFSLAVGLSPFVETVPTSGKVGTAVIILGSNLTGATSVTFNGTPAKFKVLLSSEITTTVPNGASTGKVKVKTPGGVLTSNANFRVTPAITSFSPTSGRVGTSVTISGQSFTGATSVTFGGVKSVSFKVESYTKVKATVPSGAKTGKIAVTTPGGSATSAGTFTVTK